MTTDNNQQPNVVYPSFEKKEDYPLTLEEMVTNDMLEMGLDPRSEADRKQYWEQKGLVE